jgi:hypothetical protein
MADEITDLLQVRIEKAKAELPAETANAIAAVDWKAAIIGMRAKRGYTFEQLGDLELETELLLAGLTSPENYPKELSNRMKITSAEANDLVNEMNIDVFAKIREELIKNVERKKMFEKSEAAKTNIEPERPDIPITAVEEKNTSQVLKSAGIEIVQKKEPPAETDPAHMLPATEDREYLLKKIEKPETVHPLIAQKFAGAMQIPMVQTEYSLNNITKASVAAAPLAKSDLPDSLEKIKPVKPPEDNAVKPYPVKGDPYRLSPDE